MSGDAATEHSEAAAATAPARRPPRRRWRWLRRALLGAILARLLLWFSLLPLCNFGAGLVGLTVSWRSASLSLTHLSLHVEDLVIRDAEDDGAPALLEAQDLTLDVSTRELMRGTVRVVDAGIAGAQITLHRGADGALRLPASWQQGDVALPVEAEEQAPLRFDLPVRVDSARLHGVQLDYVDHTSEPAIARSFTIDLDLADLGAGDSDATALLRLRAPHLCDDLQLRADVRAGARDAKARFDLNVRGVRPAGFQLHQSARDLLDGADVVDARLRGELALRAPADAKGKPRIEGRAELEVLLDGAEGGSLQARFGPSETDAPGLVTPLELQLSAEGLVEALAITDGRLGLHGDRTTLGGSLEVRGLTGDRLARSLRKAGVSIAAGGVELDGDVDAELGAATTVSVARLRLRGREGDALELPQLAVRDLRANDDGLAVGDVRIVEPKLRVTRTTDGALSVAGLRLLPRPGPEAAAGADAALPRVRVGALSWSGGEVSFVDLSGAEPVVLTVADVDLRADGVAMFVDAPPGRAQFTFGAPGVARTVRGAVALAPRAAGWTSSLSLEAEGVTLDALGPWLREAGLTEALADGALRLTAETDVDLGPSPRVRARLADVSLSDGDTSWLSLTEARADGVSIGPDAIDLGALTLDQPFVMLRRTAEPGTQAFGLRFAADPGAPAAADAQPDGAAPARALRHGGLTITKGALAWSDERGSSPPQTLLLDLSLGADDGGDEPIAVAAAIRLDGAEALLRLDGALRTGAERLVTSGTVSATGLVGRELASLLPAGARCTLEDGELRGSFAADLELVGARGVDVAVRDLRVADGGAELAALDALVVRAPELSEEDVHVEQLDLNGLRAELDWSAEAFGLAGFRFARLPAQPPAERAPLRLPRLRVDAASLDVARLAVRSDGPGQAPVVASMKAELEAPWTGDPDAEAPEPARVAVSGDLQPLGAAMTLHIEANPFDVQPSLDADVSVEHLDLHRLLDLAATDGLRGEARDASVAATLHGRLDLRRRDRRSFDLSRPFGAEVVVEDFAVVDAADPTPLVRIGSVDVVARAVDLASGDVLLRSVYLDDPELSVRREQDGTHVLGVVVPPSADEAESDVETATGAEARELTVERLHVTGLALDYVDETTEPRTHLRVVDSDVEAAHLSSRARSEPRPLAFSATLRGGDVELEQRVHRSSMIGGLLVSGAQALTGSRDEHEYELRPLLDQARVDAQLTLFPVTAGQVKADVDRLELSAFRGLAARGGVSLTDGLYDARAAVDLKGHDGVRIQSDHVFTWLALQEPPNGPLSTYLRLPAPLQTVLFLLRDSDDRQRLPLNVTVPPGPGGRTAIVDAVVEGIAKMIGQSVRGAGARAASALTGMLLGAGSEAPTVTAEFAFAAGSPLPEPAALQQLVDGLRSDPELTVVLAHQLGAGDLLHARELANPAPDVLRETIAELERTRASLERARAPVAQDVVALYAAGQVQQAIRRQERLLQLDSRQGDVLEALAVARDHLDNPGERAAARRTRRAALALAEARLDAVERAVRTAAPELTPERFERRTGRPSPAADKPQGGVVQAGLRRRAVQTAR